MEFQVYSIKISFKGDKLVSALGKAGTLVLHDGNILHGSSDNISQMIVKYRFCL